MNAQYMDDFGAMQLGRFGCRAPLCSFMYPDWWQAQPWRQRHGLGLVQTRHGMRKVDQSACTIVFPRTQGGLSATCTLHQEGTTLT